MLRSWCLAVLLCLSIWTIGSRAAVCSADPPPAANDVSCTLDAPSSDDASTRHWQAQGSLACPSASVWTSQLHHAVLASARCHDGMHAPIVRDESARQAPSALRSPLHIPLLI